MVHNEIHYVPIGDGWEEVLVRNVLHYVPVLHYVQITLLFWAQKVSIFRALPFQCPYNDVAPLKTITYRAIKITGTLIVSGGGGGQGSQ